MTKYRTRLSITAFSTEILGSYPDTKKIYVMFDPKEVSSPDKFENLKIDPWGLRLVKNDGKTEDVSYDQLLELFGDRVYLKFKESDKKSLNKKLNHQMLVIDTGKLLEFKKHKYYSWGLVDATTKSKFLEKFKKDKHKYLEENPIEEFTLDDFDGIDTPI
jgi:hypothetical protein